jgi:hypothetical protein
MGYQLHPGEPVQDEVRRIADRQLEQAIAALRTVGDSERDNSVHTTRRHIKKIRALFRLVRPALDDRYHAVNRRLRAVNRLLGPIADGQAVVETLARVAQRYDGELPPDALAAIQARLLRRQATANQDATLNDVLETAAALLRAERDAVSRWTLDETGFRAIAPGLRRAVRECRDAMARAVVRPRSAAYHEWRQRAKTHWLHVRLLQARCADALAPDARRLEELDGCLGEYHNCTILREAVISDSSVAREDAALCLRLIRRYERELRITARTLGGQVYVETSRQFVKRVRRLWRAAKCRSTAQGGTSWRPAA